MLQVKAGHMDMMGLLFERYHRPLFGFLFHMTNRREASEDMLQTVFYRMLKYRHTFTGEGEFRSWMYHLARNVLVDDSKHHQRSLQQHDLTDVTDKISDGPAPDERLQKAQEMDTLQQAMAKLSTENREVLVLSRFQELKYEEIARVLNTTPGAVKVRVHRAMNELKKIYRTIDNETTAQNL